MSTKPSIFDLDSQIAKLRERRRLLVVKSAERFARAATRSGLAEMEIADDELDRIFEEIAARFRKGGTKGVAHTSASPRRQPSSGTGTPAEVSHDG